jgi:hypothetical protein
MSKLTLSVDEAVVTRAKAYAEKKGTSVSELVEGFLDVLSRPGDSREEPPILESLRGSLKGAKVDDYHRYLEKKYR